MKSVNQLLCRLRLFAVVAAGMMATTALADTALTIWQTDGSTTVIALSEQPTFTFSDSVLVLRTAALEVEYPVAKLRKFTFGETPSAIETIRSVEDVRVVFDLNGREVARGSKADDLEALPAGVYIVKENGVTFKMLKR